MLNDLPLDVLGHIFSFLVSEDRINANEILSQKVIKRFPPKYADNHHLKVLVMKWKNMILNISNLVSDDQKDKRLRKIYRFIQDAKRPVNLVVSNQSREFKETIILKIEEFCKNPETSPLHKMIND